MSEAKTTFEDDFSFQVWRDTYKDHRENDVNGTFKRVSGAISSVEKTDELKAYWGEKFYDMLSNFKVTAGGRIYSNAGTEWGGTTLMNCLSGETPVITKKGSFPIKLLSGGTFEVLSKDGVFRSAKFKSYGKQNLFKITLSNDDVLFATEGHEWIVTKPNGGLEKVTTKSLLNRRIPVNGTTSYEYLNDKEYKEGVRHGLTFGDGNLYTDFKTGEKYSVVNQFGDSRHIIVDYFDTLWTTYYCGDPEGVYLAKGLPSHYKLLPSVGEFSIDYLRGFIAGYIGADGCVSKNGCVVLHCADKEILYQIRDIASYVGLPTASLKLERDHNPFKPEEKCELWKLTFVKKYFDFDKKLIIKNKHIENMDTCPSRDCNFTIEVISIENANRFEEVYCCEEEETHTFTIGYGYLTGNCFVGPKPEYDQDSIKGIIETLLYQVQTLKSEGGWGMNFSFIRPRGSFIYGIGVESPGAVKYMELFDKASDIITAGSGLKKKVKQAKEKIRKGAMMGVLSCWHPDVQEFITAKLQEGRLSKFNISVDCTDEFMDRIVRIKELMAQVNIGGLPGNGIVALEEIARLDKWELVFPDTKHPEYKKIWNGDIAEWRELGYPINVYRTISALDLWDSIIKSTYTRNDPGVLFLDRANKTHCWNYGGKKAKIRATNPCVTGETLVYVADGRGNVPIKQLADEGKDVPVFCLDDKKKIVVRMMRNPRVTGYDQKIYKVTIEEGHAVRVTGNHKFLTRDRGYVETRNLKPGDSLVIATNFEGRVKVKGVLTRNPYRFLTCGSFRKGEHRVVAEYLLHRNLLANEVVHHKDYNPLNNRLDNLEVMDADAHRDLHRADKLGDKNPMRRAAIEWSEEDWAEYSRNMSAAVGGDKNGRYSGIENETLRKNAIELARVLGRRFSVDEWKSYAASQGITQQFSKWRNDHLNGGILGLSKWAALECGFENVHEDPRVVKTYRKMTEMGYDAEIVDGHVFVRKNCEITGESFLTPWERREVGILYSSVEARSIKNHRTQSRPEVKAKVAVSFKSTISKRHTELKEKQLSAFTELRFNLGRNPQKKEWVSTCKEQGVSTEICRDSSPFRSYNDLAVAAESFNHRVVSVEEVGIENVYNGTVDEFHNFFVGGWSSPSKSLNNKQIYLVTKNCGEQCLPFGAVCNLASLNLTQFVDITNGCFDIERIKEYVRIAVRFLDDINDYTNAPLEAYKESIVKRRRIGLGVMGWGSSLYMLRVRFGSDEAERIKSEVMKAIVHTAVETSVNLAEEKGMFEGCDPSLHSTHIFWDQVELPKVIREKMRKVGIRNSALFSIQPTGNTSIFANIVSGGLEPVFLPEYIRTVIVNTIPNDIKDETPKYWEGEFKETALFKFTTEGGEQILRGVSEDGTVYKIDKNRGLTKEVLCEDYGVRHLKKLGLWDVKAGWAVTTINLQVEDHIRDMVGFGRWIDSSMSKTVNVPNEFPYDKFENVYLDAYKTNFLKGVTTYRDGTMTTVLSAVSTKEVEAPKIVKNNAPKRPVDLNANVHHVIVKGEQYFVIVGLLGDSKDPYEVFAGKNGFIPKTVKTAIVKKMKRGHYQATLDNEQIVENIADHISDDQEAITRLVSSSLRHGADLAYVVHQLEKTKGDLTSFSKAISRALKKHIPDLAQVSGENCPVCGSDQIHRTEGCKICKSCSWSAC